MTRSEYRLVIIPIGEVILPDPSISPLSATKQAAKAGNCGKRHLILSARANAPNPEEMPGARDADPRFTGIVRKAVENALAGKFVPEIGQIIYLNTIE